MARITITTDDGVVVSSWKDTDEDDRQYMSCIRGKIDSPLDYQLSEDIAHDLRYARRQEGRDQDTGEMTATLCPQCKAVSYREPDEICASCEDGI